MIDTLSGLGIVQIMGIAVLAIAGFGYLGLGYLFARERKRAAQAVADATGPVVALVDDLPDAETAATGDVQAIETAALDGDVAADGGPAMGQARSIADSVRLESPDISGGLTGILRAWRHRAKEKRLARKGYIKWYRVGANLERPQFVKPFRNGQGELIYYADDGPYLFPEESMATDSQTGAYVAIHRKGDATPIDLNDPLVEGLAVDKLEETIDLSVESESPGLFQKMDLDSSTIIAVGIALMLALAAVGQLLGGGF